jgi:hypothetical protein
MLNAAASRAATTVRAPKRHRLAEVNFNDSREQRIQPWNRDSAAFAFGS